MVSSKPMAKVFFSIPPRAKTFLLSLKGSFIGMGAYPLDLLIGTGTPPITFTTESSHLRFISLLWSRIISAKEESFCIASALSLTIGSSDRLPDVATTGKSTLLKIMW